MVVTVSESYWSRRNFGVWPATQLEEIRDARKLYRPGGARLMPYARFDDRYDDHRKIKKALRREPAAVAMHAMAITYCSRHQSDGVVDLEWIEERLGLLPFKNGRRANVLVVLLELNLFEKVDAETFLVHDFLDWNLSADQRKSLAQQGSRGGRAKAAASSQGSSQGYSEGYSQGSSQGSSKPTPTPRPTPKNINAELRSDLQEGFSYWQETCDHSQAKFTADRRRKMEARFREGFTLANVKKAVDGAARHPFIDATGKRFDDIELICRTGAKLEDFMARADASPVSVSRVSDLDRKRLASLNELKAERGVA